MGFELTKKKTWVPFLTCDLCGEELSSLQKDRVYWSWSDEDKKKYRSVVPVFTHKKCYEHLMTVGVPPWAGEVIDMTVADYIGLLNIAHPEGLKLFDLHPDKRDEGNLH